MEYIIDILICLLSSMGTFYLSNKFKRGPIKASALISLGMIITLSFFTSSIQISHFSKLVFGASFVGMSAGSIFSEKMVFVASILFYIIFLFIYPIFPYQAGALGFSAFIACCLCILFLKVFQFKTKEC